MSFLQWGRVGLVYYDDSIALGGVVQSCFVIVVPVNGVSHCVDCYKWTLTMLCCLYFIRHKEEDLSISILRCCVCVCF